LEKQQFLCLGLLLFLFSSCAREPRTTVFCAASLSEVVTEISKGAEENFSFHSGGSHTLVSQYLGGAQADLLILADATLLDALGSERRFESKVFAGNRLVLACAKERAIHIDALELESTTLAVANPQTAPLGRYSEQALQEVDWKARRVYLKDATAVLVTLSLGHADAAVVYASDLGKRPELLAIPFDLTHHDPIRYLAVLPEPASPAAAQLYEKLTSEAGQNALGSAGFLPLREFQPGTPD
jgi:molybdate transport system substrate-binding protein